MIKTAANIIKGVFRNRKPVQTRFKRISWAQEKYIKHQEDQNIKKIQFSNYSICYKRPYELLHSYRDIFEKELYRFTTENKKPIIFDCGSNIGLSIIYFKQIYPQSKIIAFEPDQTNFDLLELNILNNNLKNIELIKAAVWTENSEISFDSNESEASRISESGAGNKVKSVRLNDLLQEYAEIDFLKIDIEGAEWHVMQDIASTLPRIKNLFLEYHGKVENTAKLTEILNIINTLGFKVYVKNAADNLDSPFQSKRTNSSYDVQLNLFCYK